MGSYRQGRKGKIGDLDGKGTGFSGSHRSHLEGFT